MQTFHPSLAGVPTHLQYDEREALLSPVEAVPTVLFQALADVDFANKNVFEAFCGCGGSSIMALRRGAASVLVNNPTVTSMDLARLNIRAGVLPDQRRKLQLEIGDPIAVLRSMTEATRASVGEVLPRFDVVIATLPQSWGTETDNETTANAAARLYNAEKYRTFRNWGLGMVDAFIHHAKQQLRPGGSLILVLNGYVPPEKRDLLFDRQELPRPVILASRTVRLSRHATIRFLHQEAGRYLFGNLDKSETLSPDEAERRRQKARIVDEFVDVFHDVLVVRCTV